MMYIYFLRYGEVVKIGKSTTPFARWGSIQTGRPSLRSVAAVAGTEEDERYLHERFAWARLQGEWFRWCPELQVAINRAVSEGRVGREPSAAFGDGDTRHRVPCFMCDQAGIHGYAADAAGDSVVWPCDDHCCQAFLAANTIRNHPDREFTI